MHHLSYLITHEQESQFYASDSTLLLENRKKTGKPEIEALLLKG